MLKFIERQINLVKKDGPKAIIREAKILLVFLLWSSMRQLTDAFGLKWGFPYFREAKAIYSRSFSKFIENGNLKAVEVTADHMASLICKGLTYQPDNYEIFEFLEGIKLFIGQVDEWAKCATIAFEKREQLLNRHLPTELGLRLFSIDSVRAIGYACHWDGLLKAQYLGLIPADKLIMIGSKEKPPANCHWMSYLEQYVIILDKNKNEHKKVIGFLNGIGREAGQHVGRSFRMDSRVYAFNHSALALIEQRWDRENRQPLFELISEDIDYGQQQLALLGIPEGAWFACLHVREGGFKGNEFFRQAPIQDYLMAIQAVVDRGGWVIRMGDPTMTPLPKMKNVLDYPHSVIYSPRMDIVLCGLCRFFIGTSSGLYCLARSFGKRIVQTNYLPTCTLYLSDQNVFLPKLARHIRNGNLLDFSEIMSAPFSFGMHDINFKQLGVEIVNNTPEEIMEIVEEMVDKLDNEFEFDAMDEGLHAKFMDMTAQVGTLYGLDNIPINCRIGTKFLRRYQHLLLERVDSMAA